MPNGGSDCCGECRFRGCRIRGLKIDNPYWHYCANHPHHNPLGIETPVGPVYTTTGGMAYRRRESHPAPDGDQLRLDLLELLRRLVAGELDRNDRAFHMALIGHLGRLAEERAIPDLVELACRPPGDLVEIDTAARFLGPETHAMRVEFLRRAAHDALRSIADTAGTATVVSALRPFRDSDDAATADRANLTFQLVIPDPPAV